MQCSVVRMICNRERGFLCKIEEKKHLELIKRSNSIVVEDHEDEQGMKENSVFALNIIFPNITTIYDKVWVTIGTVEVFENYKFLFYANQNLKLTGLQYVPYQHMNKNHAYYELYFDLIQYCIKNKERPCCLIEEENEFSNSGDIKSLFAEFKFLYRVIIPKNNPCLLHLNNAIKYFKILLNEEIEKKEFTMKSDKLFNLWFKCINSENFQLECEFIYKAANQLRIVESTEDFPELDLIQGKADDISEILED